MEDLMLIKTIAVTALAAAVTLGPPRIAVSTSNLPAGAVALIDAHYHTPEADARVYGTAYTWSQGRRVEREVPLRRLEGTHYRLDNTWGAMPVALVLGVEQGERGKHGVAEALVRVDRTGKVVAIDIARTNPIIGPPMPRRVNDREIEGALQALGYPIAE
jgi:hypothetical protein